MHAFLRGFDLSQHRRPVRGYFSLSKHTRETTHMNSDIASGQKTRSASSHADTEHNLNESISELRRDLASVKADFARLASQASGEAAKTIRNVHQTVASKVGGAASGVADASFDFASSAKQHAETFTSELEGMARRNPLVTIAGAVLVGVIIGMMTRGRS
jgi:ElaB/YqjD/DUF883 family membrane-anchored ribosome-binding protein